MGRFTFTTLMKLLIASLIVGTVLGVIGANPFDFWRGVLDTITETFETIYDVGWDGIRKLVSYTVIGAVVVVPLWLVSNLLKKRPGKDSRDPKA